MSLEPIPTTGATVPTPDPNAAWVAEYLQHVRVEKRLAQRTQALYTEHLKDLLARCATAGVGLDAVQPAHVRRWVAQLRSAGRNPRGIALVLSCWRGLYTWLGRQGRVSHHPVVGVRAPKAPKPLPKALGVEDAVRLAEGPPQEPDPEDAALLARDRCMVELLYGSGLRISELLGLDVRPGDASAGWIDAESAEVHVLGKGGKRRTVPVGRQALDALAQWLLLRADWLAARPGVLPLVHRPARAAPDAPGRTAAFAPPVAQGWADHPGAPAHVATQLCQPSAAVQQRPAGGAGTAGPRAHRHHAGVHPARFPAPGPGVRGGPPPGQKEPIPIDLPAPKVGETPGCLSGPIAITIGPLQ
jgi:integrase/recombinase XerC